MQAKGRDDDVDRPVLEGQSSRIGELERDACLETRCEHIPSGHVDHGWGEVDADEACFGKASGDLDREVTRAGANVEDPDGLAVAGLRHVGCDSTVERPKDPWGNSGVQGGAVRREEATSAIDRSQEATESRAH